MQSPVKKLVQCPLGKCSNYNLSLAKMNNKKCINLLQLHGHHLEKWMKQPADINIVIMNLLTINIHYSGYICHVTKSGSWCGGHGIETSQSNGEAGSTWLLYLFYQTNIEAKRGKFHIDRTNITTSWRS